MTDFPDTYDAFRQSYKAGAEAALALVIKGPFDQKNILKALGVPAEAITKLMLESDQEKRAGSMIECALSCEGGAGSLLAAIGMNDYERVNINAESFRAGVSTALRLTATSRLDLASVIDAINMDAGVLAEDSYPTERCAAIINYALTNNALQPLAAALDACGKQQGRGM